VEGRITTRVHNVFVFVFTASTPVEVRAYRSLE
jgi:hypothetical protein